MPPKITLAFVANFHVSLDPIRLLGNEMPEATSAHKEKFVFLSHFPLKLPWLPPHGALTVCGVLAGDIPLILGLAWGYACFVTAVRATWATGHVKKHVRG